MIAKMRNGGEACTAANRFYVQEGILDAFAEGLAERMAAMTVGAGYDPATQLRPDDQPPRRSSRIAGLVDDAVGARRAAPHRRQAARPRRLLLPADGARRRAGRRRDHAARRSSARSPRSAAFATEDEAIARANDTEYGLIAYVYTGDLARGLRVSERIEAGMVGLNRGLVSDPAAPFGGVKQSGPRPRGGAPRHPRVLRDQVHRRQLVKVCATCARKGWATAAGGSS